MFSGCTHLWRPGWQRASSGRKVRRAGTRARATWVFTGSVIQAWSHPLAPSPDTRELRVHAAHKPRGCQSSPASYPKAAGPAGQTAGRATSGARALVAPGARLNPAPEADCRGARPRRSEAPMGGRRRVRKGRAATKAHAGKTGPAWWKSRGGSLRRDQVAGEPLGPGMRNPGPLARMGARGLTSESRAGRCLANSMHATEVKARAAGAAASTSGASWLGSPGAGLPYPSTCGLVLYGRGGATESRAWSHV